MKFNKLCEKWCRQNTEPWTRWWFQMFFFSPLPGEMIQFDRYFSSWLVQPPASESQELVQTFHVVSLLDLSFPPLKGGMMHYGGAAASGTTTAGGVLIFRCGEDKPKTFSQFLLFKKKMTSLVVEMDTMIPSPQKKFTQKLTLCFEVPGSTYLLEKGHVFFPHYWVKLSFLCKELLSFWKNPPGGQPVVSVPSRNFHGNFPVPSRFERQDDGGPTLLQRILNVGKRCVGIFARSSPPEPNPEVGRVVGGWVVETPGRQSYFPDNQSDGQWTAPI